MSTIAANAYGYTPINPYSAYTYESQATGTQRTAASTNTSTNGTGSANSAGDSSSLSEEAKNLAANRATVDDIIAYREKLRKQEANGYREELVRFGMRAEAQFEIKSDGKGGYTIKADYRDKPFLEAYFRENPDHAQAFMKQDKLTAKDVLTYQEGLQEEFDKALKAGLEKLGLAEDAEYEVTSNGKGGYTIKADEATTALIEGYLKENPSQVKTLTKIATAMDVDLSKGQSGSSADNSTSNDGNLSTAGPLDTPADKAARKQLNQLATFLLMQAGSSSGINPLQISNYKKDLQAQFEAQMKSDLRKLGVDEDIKFSLKADKQGNVIVLTSSEDKAVIEKYLKDNPEMANAFVKLEKVSGDSFTAQSQRYDVAAVRQRIQLESMNAWFMGTGTGSGLGGSAAAAGFGGADMALLNNGLNKLV